MLTIEMVVTIVNGKNKWRGIIPRHFLYIKYIILFGLINYFLYIRQSFKHFNYGREDTERHYVCNERKR